VQRYLFLSTLIIYVMNIHVKIHCLDTIKNWQYHNILHVNMTFFICWKGRCTYNWSDRQTVKIITLSLLRKLSSAKQFVCFKFRYSLIFFKIGQPIVSLSNSLNSDQTPSYSASELDSNCLNNHQSWLAG